MPQVYIDADTQYRLSKYTKVFGIKDEVAVLYALNHWMNTIGGLALEVFENWNGTVDEPVRPKAPVVEMPVPTRNPLGRTPWDMT